MEFCLKSWNFANSLIECCQIFTFAAVSKVYESEQREDHDIQKIVIKTPLKCFLQTLWPPCS